MSCKICGDEGRLTPIVRFWDPDDGWKAGRLCDYCKEHYGPRKPHQDDCAYDKSGDVFSDEDDAINEIYG